MSIMNQSHNSKKINFASVEMIKLLGELELTPKESLEVVTKVMHFVIEKGFCQSEAKTSELITRALGTMAITNAVSQN